MPYIKVAMRAASWIRPEGSGPLCYALSRQIQDYRVRHGDSFATYSDILAALEATKMEFYRCVVVPYEEGKRQENGDVWA